MSQAAKSIFYFSFWVFVNGAVLLFFPNWMLALLGIDESAAIVARIFGVVLLYLAFYYFMAGRRGDMSDFYRWTTYTRPTAMLFALVFVLTKQVPPMLLAFVSVDVLGALWTWFALRNEMKREML